jgi:hypothetical protein
MRIQKMFGLVFVVFMAVMTTSAAVCQEPAFSPAQELAPGIWLSQTISPETTRPCVPDEYTLCFHDGRFSVVVTVDWMNEDGGWPATVQNRISDVSGTYWFYSPYNIEVAVKMLDGCWINGRYWAFVSVMSDQPIMLEIRDIETGMRSVYITFGGRPASWGDTEYGFWCL